MQNILFALNGIRTIPTLYLSQDMLKRSYSLIKDKFSSPFILKAPKQNKGFRNFLVKDHEHFLNILKYAPKSGSFIAQPFLESDLEERYLVMGGKVTLMIRRSRSEGSKDHRINAKGMVEEIVTDQKGWRFKDIAEKISALKHQGILGIDILIERTTGLPYVLEANAAPGMNVKTKESLLKVDKFQEYILKEIKKKRP